jgi:Ulp1 family protease
MRLQESGEDAEMEEEKDKSFETDIEIECNLLMNSLSTCKPELNFFGTQLNLKHSLKKLLPGQYLNDEIINMMLSILS